MRETRLFSPFRLRDVTFRNRIAISPMQVYMAGQDGLANDWHLQHLGKFAAGGAGLVFTEGLIIHPLGRSSYGDCGIWSDDHIAPLRRITDLLHAEGAVAGAQLHHAGAKAARRRAWDDFRALDDEDAARGEPPWQPMGVSAARVVAKYHAPRAMSDAEVAAVPGLFADGARRVDAAGFDVAEIHAAHGYLIHSFLSPISNDRTGPYGGDMAGRMRLALEVAEAVRAVWPEGKPLFFRLSCIDGLEGGWSIEDSIRLATELRLRGVDLIDCSSGGIRSTSSIAAAGSPPLGYQVPHAARIRREAGIATMAVGLIIQPEQAEIILQQDDADLIAIGRVVLENPNWPLTAAYRLGSDPDRKTWPKPYGWALRGLDAARSDNAEETGA
ncbi:MAG: NADH:flavin oxidoreductase/NADH oxidase [Amaricoccus sp.]|uniref:NADH:flavin oxidoreductase/NADH oxidase n=1 Tax=Amaricoccus sp. TaxID=1872485 RepID=UPI0039E56677